MKTMGTEYFKINIQCVIYMMYRVDNIRNLATVAKNLNFKKLFSGQSWLFK